MLHHGRGNPNWINGKGPAMTGEKEKLRTALDQEEKWRNDAAELNGLLIKAKAAGEEG
jgi:hypothetical protein